MIKKKYSVFGSLVPILIGLLIFYIPVEGAARKHNINYPAYTQGIDYGKGITYIIGHNPPDTDSVCTAVAYANLKQKLGINAEARIVVHLKGVRKLPTH